MDEVRIPVAGDPFYAAGRRSERSEEQEDRPHACLDGWIYLGFEREEDSELVEITDRVRCRRCAREEGSE